jgi:uncharacterized protein YdcH (DUF465 family)
VETGKGHTSEMTDDVSPSGEDFEVLQRRHRDLEKRLADLDRHISLSPAEQTERVRLKKEKLKVKDLMQALVRAAS